jgi:hypothetical protein
MFVYLAAKTDRVRHVAPHRSPRLFKLAKQKGFFSASGKQCLDCFKVCASHGKNVCRSIDQRGCERLTAQIADVRACFCADFDGVKTWRLAAHCMHTGRNNFNVLSVPKQAAKKPFRNRAAADITCADKEDAFHNSESASERDSNLELNWFKSILPMWERRLRSIALPFFISHRRLGRGGSPEPRWSFIREAVAA